MENWQSHLKVDPLPHLLSSQNEALTYFVTRDLLHKRVPPLETVWRSKDAVKILTKQQENGSWSYPGKTNKYPDINYDLLETFRNTAILVEKYGFTDEHPAIQKSADYLFSCQTEEGDYRGIYGKEYAPNYSAAIMEILIKADYANNPRIEKGFSWLLSMRQDDGGWASPLRTVGVTNTVEWSLTKSEGPLLPDRSKPFSHLFTGMVVRAFAAHPVYKHSEEALKAGTLLLTRFFKPDKYVDRKDRNYWEKVSFPFWFIDIVSALDSLSQMGFSRHDERIDDALTWLKSRQQKNGLFKLTLLRTKDKDLSSWITLAVCRIFQRFYT